MYDDSAKFEAYQYADSAKFGAYLYADSAKFGAYLYDDSAKFGAYLCIWTLWKVDQKYLESFKVWCWKRMEIT